MPARCSPRCCSIATAPVDYYLRAASRDLITAFPYATVVAAAWIVIAYFFHQNMIDAVTGGQDVTRQEQPRLYNLLENLCISRGIPMPKLKIMDSDALNAFATGLNRRQYCDHRHHRAPEDARMTRRSRPCSATSSPTSATATCR